MEEEVEKPWCNEKLLKIMEEEQCFGSSKATVFYF